MRDKSDHRKYRILNSEHFKNTKSVKLGTCIVNKKTLKLTIITNKHNEITATIIYVEFVIILSNSPSDNLKLYVFFYQLE